MTTVFPAVDVLTAREAGDGGALPEFNVNVGGGQTFGVNVTRHGLALKVANRFIEQSTYPWLQWWLQLDGNALAPSLSCIKGRHPLHRAVHLSVAAMVAAARRHRAGPP